MSSLLLAALLAAPPVADSSEPIQLFNRKNLDGWGTYTVQTGHENPGIFAVEDGILKIAGGKEGLAYYGGMYTDKEYDNYRLVVEYKFTGPTFGKRKGKSRDNGILLHCVGPHGPGPWMTSVECQIIEGGTGDFILVPGLDDEGKPFKHHGDFEVEKRGGQWYYTPGAPEQRITTGRINWYGRDPEWKDVVGFRGSQDVESPLGEWTRVEVICDGNSVTNIVNGKVVNKGTNFALSKGRILIQTEGAEMLVRKIELTPLEKKGT
ncbi:hypothetical protein Pan216_40080 [Planctomycetes bacterium Pan216]|uniref:3-keto-alpha-glucoside-1,2-lyase/3-keto-2-hydroxy-glucal hydratase domain-containing protein n=1 Tax=Kolteria novifilia TaxID=2527975 RepID=A0A518B855_9BACT|nr:hypothetical protein Pan216_40080 [Planctomycetes bacterium Pan216]